jgi:RHS repeat-associated protein
MVTSGTNNQLNYLDFTWTNFPATGGPDWYLSFGYSPDGTSLNPIASDNFSEESVPWEGGWINEPAPSGSNSMSGLNYSLGTTGYFYMQLQNIINGTTYYASTPMLIPVSQLGGSFNFNLPATCAINLNSGPGGSATASPSTAFSGSTVTLTATPAAGHTFSAWVLNDPQGGNISSFTANPATFIPAGTNPTITATFTTTGAITTAGTGSCTYAVVTSGTNNQLNYLDFTWTNFPTSGVADWYLSFGYSPDGVTLNQCDSQNFSETDVSYYGYTPVPSGTNAYYEGCTLGTTGYFYMQLQNIVKGTTYYASSPMLIPLTQLGNSFNFNLPATCSITVNPGQGGTASATPSTAFSGSTTTLIATPSFGYSFSSWTFNNQDGGWFSSSSANPTTFIFAGTNATVTANFSGNFTITVSAGAGGSASASPTTGGPGSTTTLTASPSSGYAFSSWTVTSAGGGSISSATANPATFTFGTTNATVMATFIQTYTISVNATVGGSAVANPTLGPTGSTTTLTASPLSGYRFYSWTLASGSPGLLPNPPANPTTFTFGSGNASVTANFALLDEKTGDLGEPFLGTDDCDPLGSCAEPIDTGNGSHYINLSLLKIHGAQDLDFVIDYNSIAHFNDLLGPGWSHNFEAWLQPLTNGSIQVNWNAKKFNVFSPTSTNANLFTCPDFPVIYDTLTLNANGTFSLREPSQRHCEFDTLGRLQQVVNPHGQAIQLVYQTTNSCPTQIVDSISGNSLTLNYNASNLLAQISDNLGRTVSFSYDSSNHLTRFIKGLGTVFQTNSFTYDSIGHILTETNAEGIGIFTDSYDGLGRVVKQQDSRGGISQFSYNESETNRIITTVIDRTGATNIYVHDQNYLLLSITDGLGNTTSYGYDTNGNKIAITNALSQVQSFAYDSSGNVISATDAANETTTSGYDNHNNLLSLTNAIGSTASFTYDTNNDLTESLDFLGNQVTMAYDTNSQLAQTVSPRGGISTFVHASGLLSSATDAANNMTSMAYDAVGRLIAVTNADGFVSTNAYDLNDNLIATSDGLGNTWRYTYDSAGRKLSSTDPLGHSTLFVYNGNGDLIATTNALGGVTSYTYDAEDRLVSVTDANGHTRSMAYDAAGRLISVADALNQTNFFQYDAVGNLLATVDALGITNQITTYDVRNQPIVTQDALGNQKHMSYDALQRLIQAVDALSRTNAFAYDPLSRLTNSLDPLSLATQQQFDSDGNRTGVINPKGATTSFAYDLANRLLTNYTPTGEITAYALDGRNLVTNITQPSGTETALTYDAAGRLTQSQDSAGTIAYTYDNKGRVLTISENGKTITRKYDALDRLTNYTDVFGNVLQYAYDAVGNLTNLTYPNGAKVVYGYDAANRLVTVTDWNNSTTAYTYDADNRILRITHPNSTITTRSYDLDGRLAQQLDATSGSNLIYQVIYSYDAEGQIIGEFKQPQPTPYQPATTQMAFDPDNALISYAGQTVSNDLNGNMIYGPNTNGTFAAYSYDVRNRLTATGGLAYGYDPTGNRIAITNEASVTQFVVNPNAALSQVLMRIQNGMTNYYVYGAGLLYEVTPSNGTNRVLTYHFDYRGSTVAMTDVGGNVQDRVSYSPYGGITSRTGTTDTPFLFNGSYGVMNDANGLLYMRARYYNVDTSRFLIPDPTGFFGGANFYSFVSGNPESVADPSGLCADYDTQGLANEVARERLLNVIAIEDSFISTYIHDLVSQGYADALSDVQFADLVQSTLKLDPAFLSVYQTWKYAELFEKGSTVLGVVGFVQTYRDQVKAAGEGNGALALSYYAEGITTVYAGHGSVPAAITLAISGTLDYADEQIVKTQTRAQLIKILSNALADRYKYTVMLQTLRSAQR